MMSTMEVLRPARTLDELAEVIAATQVEVNAHLHGLLSRALDLGQMLADASMQLPEPKDWNDFLGRVQIAPATANTYLRIHSNRDHIPEGVTAVTRALAAVSGRPNAFARPGVRFDQATREVIWELKAAGLPQREIAETLGLTESFVSSNASPERAEAARIANRQRAARAAQAQRERRERAAEQERKRADTLAKGDGGAKGETYSLVRKACQKCEQAAEAASGDEREALNAAYRALEKADQALVRALGVG